MKQCPKCYEFIKLEQEDKIVDAVIGKFIQRSEVGIKKYGTTLNRDDLSHLQWITHLQEELMDAILYIERLKKEFND
jgi:hypothetical protein